MPGIKRIGTLMLDCASRKCFIVARILVLKFKAFYLPPAVCPHLWGEIENKGKFLRRSSR